MNTISVYKIDEKNDLPFDAVEYSKFKFGCKNQARLYGDLLARKFWSRWVVPLGETPQIVVCSSPYNHIPTATFAMKDYFIRRLNTYIVEAGYPPAQETKIHRTNSYTEDYGSLSAVERMRLIGGDQFHIDESFIHGKTVLFLDDIKITGSHERVIKSMLRGFRSGVDYKAYFLYLAELVNPSISPSIENDLNYAYVKKLADISRLIRSDNFLLNTRTVKYILNSPTADFLVFTDYQSKKFLRNLYHEAIGNSYHLIEAYKTNLELLKQLSL